MATPAETTNIWTSGLNEEMNITIDNYNDLYLIKEQKIV